MKRIPGVVAAALALAAALPLTACSGSSSSGSSTSASSTASDTTPSPSATVSLPTPSLSVSIDAARVPAILQCLQKAGVPTPTSTEPAQVAQQIVPLLQDPKVAAALRGCGITIPGLAATSSSPS